MQRTRTAIGLDLGSQTVKLVRLTLSPQGLRVEDAAVGEWPADASNTEEKAAWLRDWLQSMKLRNSRVMLAVAGSFCNVQLVRFPQTSDSALARMAKLEAQRLAGITAQDVASDFIPYSSMEPGETPVMLALCRTATIEAETKLATEAGLTVQDVSLSNLALSNAFTFDKSAVTEGLTAFVDVGRDSTNIALSQNGVLRFARSFASGAGAFTTAVAHAAQLSFAEAEQWKQTHGQLFCEGYPTGAKENALHQAAEYWLREFNETLTHFFEQARGEFSAIDRIVLVGGGALLRGFAPWLAHRTGKPVDVGSPLQAPPLGTSTLAASVAADPRFAVALGLALQGLRKAPSLSLLPDAVKERRLLRQRTQYLVACTALATLIFLTLLAAALNELKRVDARLEAQHKDLRACQELATRIENWRDKTRRVNDMLQPILDLTNRADRLLLVWRDLASLRAESDWFTLYADADSYFPRDKLPSPSPASLPPRGGLARAPTADSETQGSLSIVIVEGYTSRRDYSSVTRLLQNLEAKGPYYKKADFMHKDRRVPNQRADEYWERTRCQRFTLEIQLDWAKNVRTEQPRQPALGAGVNQQDHTMPLSNAGKNPEPDLPHN